MTSSYLASHRWVPCRSSIRHLDTCGIAFRPARSRRHSCRLRVRRTCCKEWSRTCRWTPSSGYHTACLNRWKGRNNGSCLWMLPALSVRFQDAPWTGVRIHVTHRCAYSWLSQTGLRAYDTLSNTHSLWRSFCHRCRHRGSACGALYSRDPSDISWDSDACARVPVCADTWDRWRTDALLHLQSKQVSDRDLTC